MDFTPEVEDEVIMDTVYHKLDIPLVNPSNKFWIYSTQTRPPPSLFLIDEALRYTNEEHNEMVEMVDIKPMILVELITALSY